MTTQNKLRLLQQYDIVEYKQQGFGVLKTFNFIDNKFIYTGSKKEGSYVKSIKLSDNNKEFWLTITDRMLESLTIPRLDLEELRNEKLNQLGI